MDRKLPTPTSNDLPRAVTEFGQHAEVSPSRWPVVGVAINQSAIALLRLFGRRLLNLHGGNPIRLRRINRDDSEMPVRVARSNGYPGLFSRRSGNDLAVHQYGHPEPRAGIARVDLFDFLFGGSLATGARALGAGFALNEVQATVPRGTWHIDGIGFHDAALFSGSALGLLAHHTRDLT